MEICIYQMKTIPGGQENHSRQRFFFHFAFEPLLASAWASNVGTKGKGIREISWAFMRLFIASDKYWESHCCLASSIQMIPGPNDLILGAK